MRGDVEVNGTETGDLTACLNELFDVMHRPNSPSLLNAQKLRSTKTLRSSIYALLVMPATHLIHDDQDVQIDAQLRLMQALRDRMVCRTWQCAQAA
ncbi:hypothetical protein [Mycobacterium sp. E3247]|uniref:hypothetical protein n=1 Tax=Mycobacterium sp. E3247 TaxID=1856864 RepID=UPI0007FC5272|nr:hypothetical protein [Mycobacterium sp. E3247]OBH15913.1 hypothetical protein A9X04_12600 [Mycobacterium sp. E3247]